MQSITVIICSNRQNKAQPQILSLVKKPQYQLIFIKNSSGVSKARNLAIKKAIKQSDIMAFTDDDCIPNQNWLKEIAKSFQQDPQLDLLFGQTLPFQKQKHPGQICPCTFSQKNSRTISQIVKHWEEVGFSNNMAVRADVFKQIGTFKWWLGPGSIGSNGEDAEFILRAILKKKKIAYNPKMVIYHNKWLNSEQLQKQNWSYQTGGIAAYGFYAYQGNKKCQQILKEQLIHIKSKIWQNLKSLKNNFRIKNLWTKIYTICNEIFCVLRGLSIAFIFAKIISIPKKEKI